MGRTQWPMQHPLCLYARGFSKARNRLRGLQLPLGEVRNDAVENMLGALALAGSYSIPEVCLFFRSELYRGNRVRKVDASAFDAFDSVIFSSCLCRGGHISSVESRSIGCQKHAPSGTDYGKECGGFAFISGCLRRSWKMY